VSCKIKGTIYYIICVSLCFFIFFEPFTSLIWYCFYYAGYYYY